MITVTALSAALQDDVLEHHGTLGSSECETWNPKRFASAYLLERAFKKQRMELDDAACDNAALQTFLEANSKAGQWVRPCTFEWEEELLGLVKRHLYNFFYPKGEPLLHSWDQILAYGDLGTGSNTSSRSTDFYSKLFDGPLVATSPELYFVYSRVVSRNPTWATAEENRKALGHPNTIVSGGKLSFVRKNDTTSRTILTEPTLNMFFQRGISNILEDRLKSFGLSMADQQDRNKALANLGSIYETFSTLDLKSASDSIALSLCEEFIPRSPLSFMKWCRTPVAVLPNGKQLGLNMMSTMGNGFTSTLQTVFFMCCVFAAFDMAEQPRFKGIGTEKNWGVFGDDMIVPTGKVSRFLVRILELLGFTINMQKSFLQGPFRESCGGDYLLGVNVRPFYCKTWNELPDLYNLWNYAASWITAHHRLPRFMKLVSREIKLHLSKRAKDNEIHLVPTHFPSNSGVFTSYYHAVRALPKDSNGSIIVRYLISRPQGHTVYEDGIDRFYDDPRKRARHKNVRSVTNSAGLLIAFVRGGVSGVKKFSHCSEKPRKLGQIPCRARHAMYATTSESVPSWDSMAYPVVSYHWPTLGKVGGK